MSRVIGLARAAAVVLLAGCSAVSNLPPATATAQSSASASTAPAATPTSPAVASTASTDVVATAVPALPTAPATPHPTPVASSAVVARSTADAGQSAAALPDGTMPIADESGDTPPDGTIPIAGQAGVDPSCDDTVRPDPLPAPGSARSQDFFRSFRTPLPPAPLYDPPGPRRIGLQAGHWLKEDV